MTRDNFLKVLRTHRPAITTEGATALEAHVTTRDSLHPTLRTNIERQSVRVF